MYSFSADVKLFLQVSVIDLPAAGVEAELSVITGY